MSWRHRLQSGSFRNVPFLIESATGQGGRHVAVHEFVNHHKHYSEDMGKKAGSQRLTVYLLGDDYDQVRDRLIEALEQPGPGELKHPYRGTQKVQIQEYSWEVTSRRGGYCSFNITYITAGKRTPPTDVSTQQQLLKAVTVAEQQTATGFIDQFECTGQPAFVVDNSLSLLEQGFDELNAINGAISAELNQLEDIANDINALSNELTELVLQPLALINKAGAVFTSVIGGFKRLSNAFDAYQHLLDAFAISRPVSRTSATGTVTATRSRMADNQQAIHQSMSALATLALIKRIATANTSEFESLRQAQQIREGLMSQLDHQLENRLVGEGYLTGGGADDDGSDPDTGANTISAEQYDAISDLAATLQRHLSAIEPGLLTLQTITLTNTLPALVVMHQHYGSISQVETFIDRNRLEHPLFVAAGLELEVPR